MSNSVTVYVRLLDEGTEIYKPVTVEHVGNCTYRLWFPSMPSMRKLGDLCLEPSWYATIEQSTGRNCSSLSERVVKVRHLGPTPDEAKAIQAALEKAFPDKVVSRVARIWEAVKGG